MSADGALEQESCAQDDDADDHGEGDTETDDDGRQHDEGADAFPPSDVGPPTDDRPVDSPADDAKGPQTVECDRCCVGAEALLERNETLVLVTQRTASVLGGVRGTLKTWWQPRAT